MKRFVSVAILSACLLVLVPVARAQNCSNLSNLDLRGTYIMYGSGWLDLSKMLAGIPGLPPMPTGFAPMTWVGAHTWNGQGGGGGWVSINSGGMHMTAKFVNLQYSLQPDCSIQVSFFIKINELPAAVPPVGPIYRVMVPVWTHDTMELHMIMQGAVPGAPTAGAVDSGVSYRVSMLY
jgi:hypothetical protein